MQARDKHSSERPPWESRRVGRMRARLAPQQAFISALRIRDGCHKDWMVVRVLFPCKNPSYPHYESFMTDLFFATYSELLTKAWKMHGSYNYIVVHILIELASNST